MSQCVLQNQTIRTTTRIPTAPPTARPIRLEKMNMTTELPNTREILTTQLGALKTKLDDLAEERAELLEEHRAVAAAIGRLDKKLPPRNETRVEIPDDYVGSDADPLAEIEQAEQ